MTVKYTYFIFSIILCILFASNAKSDEFNAFLDLTLEELLNTEVSVASRKPETVIETPAIVSRYNRVDLEKMGITTLREMFNFIPGVIVQDSLSGWATVQIRGIDEAFNQKVLFLLDGVPYHQPSHSLVPMEGVPWESISHVEVIRGPGTVFHGTQASGGVFNVITRTDIGKSSIVAKLGSNKLKEGSGFYNRKLSDESSIFLSAEYRKEDGYDATYNEVFPEVGLITDEVKRYLERKSALLRYIKNDLKIQFQAFTDATVGMNDQYADENTLQPFYLSTKGQLIHIENSWEINSSRLTLFADYNHYTFDIQINNFFEQGVDMLAKKDNDGAADYRHRLGGSFDYNFNDSLDLVIGFEHETRSIGSYRIHFLEKPNSPLVTAISQSKVDEISAYTRLDYNIENWRFLLGARIIDNELSGEEVMPRISSIYTIDEFQSLKMIYSKGFNSPNPIQTSIHVPGNLVGNPSLSAEVVKTLDIAYSYSKSNMLFVANIYTLSAEHFIQRRFNDELGIVSFYNEGNFKRIGAEIDFQMALPESKIFANLSYQKEGNTIKINDSAAFNTPRVTLSVGASTDFGDIHSFGGNISYIGPRHNLDGYSIINLNYTARFSHFEIFTVVRNILDTDIFNPDIATQNSSLVAQGEKGVNAQLGIRVQF